MSRFLRRAAFVSFVAASAFLVASLSGKPQLAASAQASPAQTHALRASKDNYDLTQMETLRKVIVQIKDYYVDPKRINPKEMFLAALEAIEKSTAEVMVHGDAKEGRVTVTCGNATKEFRFDDVESIWMIPHRMKPIFAFIQDNLVSTEKKRDIEYNAINGMLSTLDPHSWLLNPEMYREMKLQTRGEFGGLGFVIQMDEDKLMVRRVLKNTPASRAGIKKGDHITRIEDESTVNMDLNDAVTKLRGKPGTSIRIWIKRTGVPEKPYTLTRDLISIESVTSQLLPGDVGYVHISSFAGTTSRDLAAAIRDMKEQAGGHIKGLVMDLRSNPGGLLEQAIQVADQFIDEGAIVTTAGMGDKMREPKMAHNDPGDREFPVALLVNSESASASEIVSGAMKNLNRAVIIGRQTFGKGSVQVLYDLPESGTNREAALKLTIAQYLTPGDKSIQEIGVTPDIQLIPATITKARVDLFAPPKLLREVDLDKHFNNGFLPQEPRTAAQPVDKPSYTLRYLQDVKPGKKVNPDGDDPDDDPAMEEPDDDHITSDYQVLFARDLILRAPETTRLGMLKDASAFLEERRAQEDAKIEKAIEALGVDWSVNPNLQAGTGPANATVRFEVSPPHPEGAQNVTLTASVTNNSNTPMERLRSYTRCDADKTQYDEFCHLLDRREFLFGKVNPGETRSWSTSLKVPNYLPATHEGLTMLFQEAHGYAPADKKVAVESLERPPPAFAFNYSVLNRTGLAEPGQDVSVEVNVKNTGAGPSSKNTSVSLIGDGDDKIFIQKGRAAIGPLARGETKSAVLTLEVRPGFDASQGIPLKVSIADRDMWVFSKGAITLPGVSTPPAYEKLSGAARVRAKTALLAGPVGTAPVVAQTHREMLLPIVAKEGDFLKVEWGKGRVGYVAASDVRIEDGVRVPPWRNSDTRVTQRMSYLPPVIEVNDLDTTKSAPVVTGGQLHISGVASDPLGLEDVRVFLNNEKVFFRTARGGPDATETPIVKTMPFSADLTLKPGNNSVLVVARQNDDFLSQKTIVIYRQVPPVPVAQQGENKPSDGE